MAGLDPAIQSARVRGLDDRYLDTATTMNLKSQFAIELVGLLGTPPTSRSVALISEVYRGGGTDVVLGVDRLRIRCIAGPWDLTMAVQLEGDREWAGIPYLYLFLAKPNELNAIESMTNSKKQLAWLVENFDRIYALFCDASSWSKKMEFEVFQTRAHQEWLRSQDAKSE